VGRSSRRLSRRRGAWRRRILVRPKSSAARRRSSAFASVLGAANLLLPGRPRDRSNKPKDRSMHCPKTPQASRMRSHPPVLTIPYPRPARSAGQSSDRHGHCHGFIEGNRCEPRGPGQAALPVRHHRRRRSLAASIRELRDWLAPPNGKPASCGEIE